MATFPFRMVLRPTYQYRKGKCKVCGLAIEAGSRIIFGQSFYKVRGHEGGRLMRQTVRYHEDCFWRVYHTAIAEWYHNNNYKPEKVPFSQVKRAQINRLNARLWYLRKKGVDENDLRIQMILEQNQ